MPYVSLHFTCKGKNAPQELSKALQKSKIPTKKRFALLLEKGNYGLIQRKEKLLHGLWGFVQVDEKPEGISLGSVTRSHFKLELEVIRPALHVKVDGYLTLEHIDTLALSTVDKKIIRLMGMVGNKSSRSKVLAVFAKLTHHYKGNREECSIVQELATKPINAPTLYYRNADDGIG